MYDKNFFREAIKEAKKAKEKGEIPVGAVIIEAGKIISSAHNLKEKNNDITAHAEILAIKKASKILGNWRLNKCEMYVTLEPCPMCASAIAQSRIKRVYIGTFEPKSGACGSVVNILNSEYLNYHVDCHWVYDDESSDIIRGFFKEKRRD